MSFAALAFSGQAMAEQYREKRAGRVYTYKVLTAQEEQEVRQKKDQGHSIDDLRKEYKVSQHQIRACLGTRNA